jgi:hypothetical protein
MMTSGAIGAQGIGAQGIGAQGIGARDTVRHIPPESFAGCWMPAHNLDARFAAATPITAAYSPVFNICAFFKAEEPAMPALQHKLVDTKTGDDIALVFDIRDANGDAVDLTAAVLTYKISRRAGDAALLTKTQDSGIARSGSIATVSFNTAEIAADDTPLIGDFFGQLRVTLNDISLVVAEGPIAIEPVIT